jgi:hypothetical protein
MVSQRQRRYSHEDRGALLEAGSVGCYRISTSRWQGIDSLLCQTNKEEKHAKKLFRLQLSYSIAHFFLLKILNPIYKQSPSSILYYNIYKNNE